MSSLLRYRSVCSLLLVVAFSLVGCARAYYKMPIRQHKRAYTKRVYKPRVAPTRRTPPPVKKQIAVAPKQQIATTPKPKVEQKFNTETYDHIQENPFVAVAHQPLSTFSIDVDTASYTNVRRMLRYNRRPPKGAVRIEEFINYFTYDYPEPQGEHPFSVSATVTKAPWAPKHQLLRIGLKGKKLDWNKRPASHLVFLLDVSCSMSSSNKLPLLQRSLHLLVEKLSPKDKVSIVVYAGSSGLVLPPTHADQKRRIKQAIYRLSAGGSTNGGAGIKLAYKIAQEHFIKGGNNRVILATDGDFNVGVSSRSSLVELIKKKAKSGVFLSVLGFGMGNYKDATLEQLANKGNGNYAYIDTLQEAKKVLVQQFSGTMFTIAKDVKLQLEFNPKKVKAYRLIGYENRMLKKQDFNDDRKDAGEIGAGHTVTALYELIPTHVKAHTGSVDALRYQKQRALSSKAETNELLLLKLRYKQPQGDKSTLMKQEVTDKIIAFDKTPTDLRFAAAVAGFGMLLRDSSHKGQATYEQILKIAQQNIGQDQRGYRKELVGMIRKAQALSTKR